MPRVELEEMGPSAKLTIRRHRAADPSVAKEALRSAPTPKTKNTRTDALGETYGRVYLPKQEVEEMALRKMKGLKRERKEQGAPHAAPSSSTPCSPACLKGRRGHF